MMRVELIRAWPRRFEAVSVDVMDGASVGDVLASAGWALDAEFVGVAVFGVTADLEAPLQQGDRVELLRPLQMEPMQARRLRAQRRR